MPKIVDPEERRARFVQASWTLIAREGIGAATVRRVSAEAGFTMGALAHYFPDRDALLIESLRATHFAAGARMAAALEATKTPGEALRAVLLEALPLDEPRLQEWRVWLAYWGEAIARPALMAENARRYEEWAGLVTSVLARWIGEAGGPAAATRTVALIDGLGMQITLAGHDPGRLAEARRAALDAIDGLMADLEARSQR